MGVDRELSANLEETLADLNRLLDFKENFDLVLRRFEVGGRKAALIYVDGLMNDQILLWVLNDLMSVERSNVWPENKMELIARRIVSYGEVNRTSSVQKVVDQVLAGPSVFLLDGAPEALVIDSRKYPAREPDEPQTEKTLRGPRDGFTETLIFNTALIRRRLRDPSLRIEHLSVGTRSKTDVALIFLKDVASARLVASVRERLRRIVVDGLPMGSTALQEFLSGRNAYNPLPTTRYTQRPDVAAEHLLEGHVLVVVDGSPSILTLPATFFSHLQSAEDYYEPALPATYLRWVLLLSTLVAWLLVPLWLLLALNHNLLPHALAVLGPKKIGAIPLFGQFLLAELGLDLIRLALVHSPNTLANALGFIGTILMGQLAVSVGLFAPEVILYEAIAAIANFAAASVELGLALRILRLVFILLVGFFNWPGMVVGLLFSLGLFLRTESVGVPYLWPLIPLNSRALMGVLFRTAAPGRRRRPAAVHPQDPDRRPDGL